MTYIFGTVTDSATTGGFLLLAFGLVEIIKSLIAKKNGRRVVGLLLPSEAAALDRIDKTSATQTPEGRLRVYGPVQEVEDVTHILERITNMLGTIEERTRSCPARDVEGKKTRRS